MSAIDVSTRRAFVALALLTASCGEAADRHAPAPLEPVVLPEAPSTLPVADPAPAAAEPPPTDRAVPGPGIEDAELPAPRDPLLGAGLRALHVRITEMRARGELEAALDALSEAEAELGEHGILRRDRAWCLLEQSLDDAAPASAAELRARARVALDEADALHSDLEDVAVLRARLAVLEGDEPAARAGLAAHLERFPGDRGAHRLLGDLAFDAQEWALADTHLSLAAELPPPDGRTRLRATVAKQWLSAEGGAAYTTHVLRQGYREAARLLPENDEPLRLMVGLYAAGSPRRLQALDEVIEDDPDAVRARVRKAWLLLGASDPDTEHALAVLREAAERAPDDPDVLAETARALLAAGRIVEAVDAHVVALDVTDGAQRRRMANALDALLHPGDPAHGITVEQRVRACDALVAAHPADGRFGNNAGFWFREVAQDHEISLRYYLAAVEASPEDQDYLNDTGFLYLQHLRDRKERCEPLFLAARRLVEEDGQSPARGYWDALAHLCRYYYEIGRYQDVIVCADLRASPEAMLNGRAYPSSSARSYRAKAAAKLTPR